MLPRHERCGSGPGVDILAGSNTSHLGSDGRKAMTHAYCSVVFMGHVSTRPMVALVDENK